MKTIKINSYSFTLATGKKAEDFINSWNYATGKNENYDIFTFYGRPSSTKVNAFNYCKKMAEDLNTSTIPIITGGSSSFFSVAFKFTFENKKYLAYITARNNYIVELD